MGQTVLVIQAHPDDADISSGGAIARWSLDGSSVVYVTCTSGEAGSSVPSLAPRELGRAREEEQREAATVLGVEEAIFLRHPDGDLQVTPELRNELTELMLTHRPAVVLTHDPQSERTGHSDHWHAGQAALTAALAAKEKGHVIQSLLLFRSSDPNTGIDVSTTFETKLAALEKHRTQRSLGEAPPESMLMRARAAGVRWGVELAEDFKRVSLDECDGILGASA